MRVKNTFRAFRLILFVALSCPGVAFYSCTVQAAKRPQSKAILLHGMWGLTGVYCKSGDRISTKANQMASWLAIDFEGQRIAKIEKAGPCQLLSLNPYRVTGQHIIFGVGSSEIVCKGAIIDRSNTVASRERFSLKNGELKIHERALGAICPSRNDTVIYAFVRLSAI